MWSIVSKVVNKSTKIRSEGTPIDTEDCISLFMCRSVVVV